MSPVTEGVCGVTPQTTQSTGGMWDLSGEPQNTLPVFSPSQLGIRLLLVPTEHQEQLFSPGKEAVK